MIKKILSCVFFYFFVQQVTAKDFPITRFGAKPGLDHLNTTAINKTIEACYKNGGGRVLVPAGIFRTGTLFMKDNVELHLESGATLLASTDAHDFPTQPKSHYRSQKDTVGWKALIFANEVSNIAITGLGTIDGNGLLQKPDPTALKGDLDGRPRNLLFISCRYIHIEGIKMVNAGIWNQHYLNCEEVTVDNINVYNHSNRNNDGIDIDGCRRFTLSNSIFDTDDDAIVLKSTGPAACENIVITNCIVSSFCNAIKTGTESTGGFKNISISNCVVKPSRDLHPPIYGTAKGIAALSLEIVDGGTLDGVAISNITIEGSECPLFIRLGNRARKYKTDAAEPPVGVMRNIVINNVVAYNTGNYSSSITGITGHYIENLSLSNLQFYNEGGLKEGEYIGDVTKIKEDEKGYPQPTVWKELPSSGLFVRHAKNIQVMGLMLSSKEPDPRTPIIAVDVEGLQVQCIARVTNNTADVFFKGWNVRDVLVDTPLTWKKAVFELDKKLNN
jgi:polygalacturonase